MCGFHYIIHCNVNHIVLNFDYELSGSFIIDDLQCIKIKLKGTMVLSLL